MLKTRNGWRAVVLLGVGWLCLTAWRLTGQLDVVLAEDQFAPPGHSSKPSLDPIPDPSSTNPDSAFPTASPPGISSVEPALTDPFAFVEVVPAEPDPVISEADLIKMREQLVELTKQRAEALSPHELREAVQKAEEQLSATKAERELEACVAKLQEIQKTHPGTSAATRVNMMLKALKPAAQTAVKLAPPLSEFFPAPRQN